MNKTGIEWCDMTWNPVTGCEHGCNYCYAKRITDRFGGSLLDGHLAKRQVLERPQRKENGDTDAFPYGFKPTLHKYRLNEPMQKKKSSRIFVVSMGDLFGEWVPDEWIQQVFDACWLAKQHKYIFLTKNPDRYCSLYYRSPENSLLGTTVTCQADIDNIKSTTINYIDFLSIEPLQGEIDFGRFNKEYLKWVIVGAQTGPGAKPVKKEWVQSIIDQCRTANIPVFLKDNLNWHEKIQEFTEV